MLLNRAWFARRRHERAMRRELRTAQRYGAWIYRGPGIAPGYRPPPMGLASFPTPPPVTSTGDLAEDFDG